MSRSGRNSEKPSGQKGAAKKSDGPDRPGASGHRFGPDLACSECGILWDVHQRDPKPCMTEVVANVFTRRPSGDFENKANGDAVETATTSSSQATSATPPTHPTPPAQSTPPTSASSDATETVPKSTNED